jgi:centromeric protein E
MICCVTLAECYVEETRSTLQFGARAATVKLAPKIHEVLDDASQLRRVTRQ